MQGREPVGAGRVHVGPAFEQSRQPVQIAERGGLEDVEVGTGLEQGLRGAAVGPVARAHQRRHALGVPGAGERRVGGHQSPDPIHVTRLDRGEHLVGGACHRPLPHAHFDV